MIRNIIFNTFILLLLTSCTKEKIDNINTVKVDPVLIYKEGLEAIKKNDFFFASKKFSEAELSFEDPQQSARSLVMTIYCLYAINFYDEALEEIARYVKIYPIDKNITYVQYLKAIIFYEQIGDEERDIKPLIDANKQINFFIKKYPNTDYADDLKFKSDLIRNQLAAKEIFLAKYYIEVQKWIPAIKRLKLILSDYDDTIFIEEALHRLVEIHYHLGLEDEAKKYASVLGYNYNSSKWFEKSYQILNKDYKPLKKTTIKEKNSFINRMIKMIK